MPIRDIVQKLKKEYKNDRKMADQEFTFESESDSITLDIPMEGKTIDGSGWRLIPLIYPEVALNYDHHHNNNSLLPTLLIM